MLRQTRSLFATTRRSEHKSAYSPFCLPYLGAGAGNRLVRAEFFFHRIVNATFPPVRERFKALLADTDVARVGLVPRRSRKVDDLAVSLVHTEMAVENVLSKNDVTMKK